MSLSGINKSQKRQEKRRKKTDLNAEDRSRSQTQEEETGQKKTDRTEEDTQI